VTMPLVHPGRFAGPAAGAGAIRERPGLRSFRILLAAFVLVAVTKVHEAVPQLGFIPFVKLSGLAMMLSAFSVISAGPFREMMRTPTARWVKVIVLLALVGAPFALWKGQAVTFIVTVFWKPLVLFAVAAPAFANLKTMRAGVVALLAGTGVAALRVASGFASSAQERGLARFEMGGTFDPNESALLFLVAIPFAFELKGPRGKGRLRWYLFALLMVAGIVRTGSRAGFVGLLVMTMWYVWRAMTSRKQMGTLLVVLGAAGVFSLTATSRIRDRFMGVFNLEQDYNFTSRDGRIQVWQRGIRYMMTNPVLGVGISNFPIAEGDISGKLNEGYGIKYSAAHNSFIEIGAELGILGLVAFIAVLWTAYTGCRQLRRVPPEKVPPELGALAVATEGALLAFIVTGSFLSFAYQMVTYFLLAIAVGIRLATPALLMEDATAPAPAASRPVHWRSARQLPVRPKRLPER
jgi:O-antigen ligase